MYFCPSASISIAFTVDQGFIFLIRNAGTCVQKASGSFGKVMLALDGVSGALVAVKVVAVETDEISDELRAHGLVCDHEHVLLLHGAFSTTTTAIITSGGGAVVVAPAVAYVLELADGSLCDALNLLEAANGACMPEQRAARYTLHLLSALAYLDDKVRLSSPSPSPSPSPLPSPSPSLRHRRRRRRRPSVARGIAASPEGLAPTLRPAPHCHDTACVLRDG